MIKFFKNFRKDEDGAALAGAAYTSIDTGSSALTAAISTELSGVSVDSGL